MYHGSGKLMNLNLENHVTLLETVRLILEIQSEQTNKLSKNLHSNVFVIVVKLVQVAILIRCVYCSYPWKVSDQVDDFRKHNVDGNINSNTYIRFFERGECKCIIQMKLFFECLHPRLRFCWKRFYANSHTSIEFYHVDFVGWWCKESIGKLITTLHKQKKSW